MNLSTLLLVIILKYIDDEENYRDANDDGSNPDNGLRGTWPRNSPANNAMAASDPTLCNQNCTVANLLDPATGNWR